MNSRAKSGTKKQPNSKNTEIIHSTHPNSKLSTEAVKTAQFASDLNLKKDSEAEKNHGASVQRISLAAESFRNLSQKSHKTIFCQTMKT
jgi:hypothetical protein